MWRKLTSFLVGVTALGTGGYYLGTEEVPMKWELSCSDYVFSSPGGYVGVGYYYDDGGGYQIGRENRLCAPRAYYTYEEMAASSSPVIKGLREATVVGAEQFADVFSRRSGEKVAEPILKTDYEALKEQRRAPLKTERLIPFAEAAIARGATTTSSGSGTSLTFSHTNSGSDTFLAVGGFVQGSAITINSMTYAGDAMTAASGNLVTGVSGNNERIRAFYDTAPNSGANNVVITLSGSAGGVQGYAATYTGVGGLDAAGGTAACTSGTTCTLNLTTTAGAWGFMFYRNAFGNVTPTTNLVTAPFPESSLGAYDSGTGLAGGSTDFTVTVTTQTTSFPSALSGVTFTPAGAQEPTVIDTLYLDNDLQLQGDVVVQ